MRIQNPILSGFASPKHKLRIEQTYMWHILVLVLIKYFCELSVIPNPTLKNSMFFFSFNWNCIIFVSKVWARVAKSWYPGIWTFLEENQDNFKNNAINLSILGLKQTQKC